MRIVVTLTALGEQVPVVEGAMRDGGALGSNSYQERQRARRHATAAGTLI